MELVQIYLIFINKSSVATNFLDFFSFFYQMSLLDPDPKEKINSDPCGSGSTALRPTPYELGNR